MIPRPGGPVPLLDVDRLDTRFQTDEGVVHAVDGVSFTLEPGETLGLVGESGSGKSVTSLSILRLLPERGAKIEGGGVAWLGRDVLRMGVADLNAMRGAEISMIFQEPMTSLNPVFRVGDQVAEAILAHEPVTRAVARERTLQLFREVGLPDPESRLLSYPHEMSGGQKQRVMIAMALACNPKLLIADEPTTALDVTIQRQILDLIRELRDRRKMAVLFITHDLGVIAEIADKVAVMYGGRIVEQGPVLDVFGDPKHPYTRGLLACRPRLNTPYKVLPTVQDFMEVTKDADGHPTIVGKEMTPARFAELTGARAPRPAPVGDPLVEVTDLHVHFELRTGGFGKKVLRAVDGISFQVHAGRTLGLVGESGWGTTTTGRALLRLVEPTSGTVRFDGVDVRALSGEALRRRRRDMQIVFQDPYASLNPRLTVEQALTEPMLVHGLGANAAERTARAGRLLDEVGLPSTHLHRYPHEFSGGQRQRVCIARALACEPKFVICDESVSALDVSVQAQVLNLLKELQAARGLTYVFISHDLAVVKFMSDEMAVMQGGKIVEMGPSEAIYANPREAYTARLIEAIPRDDLDHIREIQSRRNHP